MADEELDDRTVLMFDVPGIANKNEITVELSETGLPSVSISGKRKEPFDHEGRTMKPPVGGEPPPKIPFGNFSIKVPLDTLHVMSGVEPDTDLNDGVFKLTFVKDIVPQGFDGTREEGNEGGGVEKKSSVAEATARRPDQVDDNERQSLEEHKKKTQQAEYDVIIDIKGLLFFSKKGYWPIEFSKDLQPQVQTLIQQGVKAKGKVAVSGLYNRGKTFVLNLLAGLDLKSDLNYRTKGISLKKPMDPVLKDQFFFIDSAGQYVPVEDRSQLQWTDRIATEGLIKQILLDVANIHIVVVNELTWPDQLYIAEVQQRIRGKTDVNEEVIVVHNLKTMNFDQLVRHQKMNVIPYYEDMTERPFLLTRDRKGASYLASPKTCTRHVFLIDHHTRDGQAHNKVVISEVRSWLLAFLTVFKASNIIQDVVSSINTNLPGHLHLPLSDPTLQKLPSYVICDHVQSPKVGGKPGEVVHGGRIRVNPEVFKVAAAASNPGIAAASSTATVPEISMKGVSLPTGMVTGIHLPQQGSIVPPHLLYEKLDDDNVGASEDQSEKMTAVDISAQGDESGETIAASTSAVRDPEKKSKYDLVIDITDFDQLTKTGWQIETNNSLEGMKIFAELTTTGGTAEVVTTPGVATGGWWQSGKVAVSGLFNRGKTFVLNRLAGVGLTSDVAASTKGISFKSPADKDLSKMMLLMDTAGQHVPVRHTADANMFATNWANRLGAEALLKRMVFDIANMHIIVVNELTWPDQLYIKEVLNIIKGNNKIIQEIIVVHNLKGLLFNELTAFRESVHRYYPKGIKTPIVNSPKGQAPFTYLLDHQTKTKHVFLINDSNKKGHEYNNCMFLEILSWVSAWLGRMPVVNVIKDIRDSLNRFVPDCIQFVNGKPLVADDGKVITFGPWVAESDLKDKGKWTGRGFGSISLNKNLNASAICVKRMTVPRGLVSGIPSKALQTPPHIIYDSLTKMGLLTIVIDMPGVKKDTLKIGHKKTPTGYDLEITAERKPEYKASGRTLTPSLSKQNDVYFGPMGITIPLSAELRIVFAKFQWRLESGCLIVTYPTAQPTYPLYEKATSETKKDETKNEESKNPKAQGKEGGAAASSGTASSSTTGSTTVLAPLDANTSDEGQLGPGDFVLRQ